MDSVNLELITSIIQKYYTPKIDIVIFAERLVEAIEIAYMADTSRLYKNGKINKQIFEAWISEYSIEQFDY